MKIKRIKLENIRSFESEELKFPEGRVLLSGDIGSGKSTVLLALEFALFGLQTGFISGRSLLRKSEDYGTVELEFDLNGKNIVVSRSLKRKKTSVNQDKGFLEIDGVKEQLSPEELKARVLKLMNYPPSLLKTRSNLLYRFTLYTPQEQMKHILIEKAEERINTLRRIFGIDKYKNIVSNLEIFSSKIKEHIKVLDVQVQDLDVLRKEFENNERFIQEEKQNLKKIDPYLEKLSIDIDRKKSFLEKIEEQVKTLNEIRTEKASLKAEYDSSIKHAEDIKSQIRRIQDLSLEVKPELRDFRLELEKLGKDLENFSSNLQDLVLKRSQQEIKLKEFKEMKEKITSLNICPTCRQKLSDIYKESFKRELDLKIGVLKQNLSGLEKEELESKSKVQELKQIVEKIRQEEKQAEVLKEKAKLVERQKESKQKLLESLKEIVQRQETLLIKLKDKDDNLSKFADLEKEYDSVDKELEILKEQEKKFEIEKAKVEKQLESLLKYIQELKEDISKKEKIVNEITYCKKLNEWVTGHFIPLILKIEKSVMLAVNIEFNKMFANWFSMLAENLNARIDENFTPILEQGGFEIDYGALSGGERTAAALSYRLALNQIINSLMANLSTKGLLILDEPTDGFSSEQLDKMKDVLDQLSVKQLLLVSHESKIENFVENVIRFNKENNLSSIV